MEQQSSSSWRAMGDATAFYHGSWEFRARVFAYSAARMRELSEDGQKAPFTSDALLIGTAEFLISLAIELIAKAVYLKRQLGPREGVYTHNVADLGVSELLTEEQNQVLDHAEQYVVWAGRYPTPKWTRESFKEKYDVPSTMVDGREHIDGSKIPNSASFEATDAKIELYGLLHSLWEADDDDEKTEEAQQGEEADAG